MVMKFISTRAHGFLDYTVGILLILAPFLFNFDNGGAAQLVPIVVGLLILLMAVFTNYEAGIIKKIPMSFHLTMDVILGIFLAISPWIFGFDNIVYLPHLLVGLFAIMTGLFTQRSPAYINV
jgi:hypothetical protein